MASPDGQKRRSLRATVDELLAAIEILPWTSATAQRYGIIRAELERRGKPLGALDLMIAAHAVEHDAVLATSDRAFRMVPALQVEDWTSPDGIRKSEDRFRASDCQARLRPSGSRRAFIAVAAMV